VNDLRFAFRQLLKNPGFTAVAVLTLALGIGASTAIFSVVRGVLLRPLPYHDPDRLVTVCQSNLQRGHPQITMAPANLRDWRAQNAVFEDLGGLFYASLTLTGLEKPEHVRAAWTTPNLFSVLGVPPLLGRTFVADDDPPGHRVVVLSHGLWQRRFGADQDVVGKSVTLSGLDYTVVGVMPSGFKIYHTAAVFGLPSGDVQPQLWAPYPGDMNDRTNRYFLGFARLRSGVTVAEARHELRVLAERVKQEFPAQQDWGAVVQPLDEQIVGGVRPALRLLLGAVVFVLLIACANAANLSLTRSAARGKEFAVRSALGATRPRLVGQLLTESMALALLGGSLGVLFAYWGLGALMALRPDNLPRFDEVRLDGPVLGFTLVVSVLTGAMSGVLPAISAAKADPGGPLGERVRGSSEGYRGRRARTFLVASQVTSATILLAGAGLMIHSVARLTRVDPGFEPRRLMTFDLSPAGRAYAEGSKRMNLVRQLRDRLQARPGIGAAATAYGLPFGTMINSMIGVTIEGRSTDPSERVGAGWRVVSPNYFETMGIRLLAGRAFFEEVDRPDSPPAVIVNETFCRRNFPGEDPVGKRLRLFPISTDWHEVVGVIGDVKLNGLDAPAPPEVYQSDSQHGVWMFSLIVRSPLSAAQVEKLVRDEAAGVDADLPLFNARTMDQAIASSVAPRRFTMTLMGAFAISALVLAAVGIYGVVSYSVGQQTREIGIRVALGASHRAVMRLVLRRWMTAALVGIAAGLATSLGLTRVIAHQLFDVSATDPPTLILVAAVSLLVTSIAARLPARRAATIDPMEALRHE
jgi:putative ABC transport system permease protein